MGYFIVEAETRASSFGLSMTVRTPMKSAVRLKAHSPRAYLPSESCLTGSTYLLEFQVQADHSRHLASPRARTRSCDRLIPLESSHTSWRALRRRLRRKNRDSRRSPHQLAAGAQSSEGSETQLNAIRRLSAHVI